MNGGTANLKALMGRFQRPIHVFGNQGFNSLTSFIYTVFLVRSLGVQEFGTYSVYYLIALNAAALGHAIVSQPAVSIGATLSSRERSSLFSAAATLLVLVSVALGAITGAIPAAAGALSVNNELSGLTLCLLTVSLLAPEFVRRMLLFSNRLGELWILDVTRFLVTALLFYLLLRSGSGRSEPYLAAFACSHLLTLVFAAVINRRALPAHLRLPEGKTLRRLLRSGKWLGLTSILQFFNEHFHILVASVVMGSFAVGVVRAIQNLVGLANPILIGLEHLLPLWLGADAARLGEAEALRRYRIISIWITLAFTSLMVALGIAAEPLLALIMSEELAAHAWILQAFCGVYVLLLIKSLLTFVFRYGEHTMPVMIAIGAGSLASVLTAFPLIGMFGLAGIMAGIALAQAVVAVTMTLLLARWLKTRPEAAPEPDPLPRRTRVLLSAFSCSPIRGSEPGVGWNWAVELMRTGYDVTVITRHDLRAEIEQGLVALKGPANLHFVYVDLVGFLNYRQFGLVSGYVYLLLWQILAFRAAQKLHRAQPFDIAHHITFGSVRSPSFMGALRIPSIFGPLGGGESPPMPLRRHFPLRGKILESIRDLSNAAVKADPLMRLSFALSGRILLKTPDSLRYVPARFRPKCAIAMEIGVEQPARPMTSRATVQGPVRVLFVGRQLYLKGMGLGLPAFAKAYKRTPSLRLSMAGEGPELETWRQQAEALGIGDAVEWLGVVPKHAMNALYQAHDLLLFPSLRDSSGNVIFEAAANGLPVVCLDIGGPGKLVEQSFGIKVAARGRSEAEVIAGLAGVMTDLVENKDLLDRLSLGALAWSRQQTWSRRVQEVYAGLSGQPA